MKDLTKGSTTSLLWPQTYCSLLKSIENIFTFILLKHLWLVEYISFHVHLIVIIKSSIPMQSKYSLLLGWLQ